MNKIHLKTAIRNLRKKSLFAMVNMGGLTFGMLCALLIGTYVLHELSYDTFYPESELIYRVNVAREFDGVEQTNVLLPTALKPYFDERVGQIALAARVQRTGDAIFRKGDQFIKESDGFFSDSEFFEIFGLELLEGDTKTALTKPQGIVISESLRQKYFDNAPALGKSLVSSSPYRLKKETFIITGVYADLPSNAHLQPNFLYSIERLRQLQRRPIDAEWSNNNTFTYVKLSKSAKLSEVNSLIANAVVEGNTTYDATGNIVVLQPITDIHMQAFSAFGDVSGNISTSYIYILSGIGLLILGLVCINFFNLSTARSLERAKEVGVRKSIGASRSQLIGLYLSETALQVILSLLLALILFEVTGDYLGTMLGSSLNMDVMISSMGITRFVLFSVALVLMLTLGAGFYPAMVLSGFKPVDSLKGKITLGRTRFNTGKSLLVIQFMITLTIGVVAAVIYTQVSYMKNADPGYDRESIAVFKMFNSKKITDFGEGLSSNPLVSSVTYTDDDLHKVFNSSSDYSWKGKPEDKEVMVYRLSVDESFIEGMDIRLLYGRNFDPKLETDQLAVLLNRSAATLMGINETDELPGIKKGDVTLNVVGIVDDFKIGDFRDVEKPLVLHYNPNRFYQAYVRLNAKNKQQAIKSIETTWLELLPEVPFEYTFLDDAYERLLRKDQQTSNILLFFTGVSVLISFIGLFGMIRLRVQSRLKELGIRKILGARFRQILKSISKEFIFYLLLAIMGGVPLSIYTGNLWLSEFTDHITITAFLPVLVVILMLSVALLTLFCSTIPLTRLNLVETLKED